MKIERIILVTRQTRLEESISRFNTKSQAKFFIEKRGHAFGDYELEYDNYRHAREAVIHSLPGDIKLQIIDRSFLPNFIFTESDAVITLGQDGLVVNAAKYLSGQPIIAVNPDPDRFDGILLPFLPPETGKALSLIGRERFAVKRISMARIDLNDGQALHAFNDFFIGPRSHTSARYTISYRGREERQSSSGVIVSTPAGSTGWMSSIFNMARGVYSFEHPSGPGEVSVSPLPDGIPEGPEGTAPESAIPDWEERRLLFAVREPFRSRWSGADIVAGEILDSEVLSLMSHMPGEGVIFSDGMLSDFLEFNSGTTAAVSIAEKTTNLVVP